MVNEDHEPTEEEETILTILQRGRHDDEPWGYTTPRYLKQRDIPSPDYHLGQLETAGWITRDAHGFYRYVEDPRTNNARDGAHENEDGR